MPDIIVVQDGELQNFLAWTTTYVPQLCPMTALVRVVEHRVAAKEVKLAGNKAPPSSDRGIRHLRGCLGIVNAEVVAACHGSLAPFSAGLTPHLSTLSWLALQVHYLNSDLSLRGVHEAWSETRRLLDARHLNYSSEIEEIWSIVTDEVDINPERRHEVNQIRNFLSAVAERKASDSFLEATREHAEAIKALQTGPLEGRMEVFRRLLQELYGKRDTPTISAVLVGYGLSQISQGSFSHIGLLGPNRVFDVRPLLWYGWFEFSRENAEPSSSVVAAANLQLLKRIQELNAKPSRGNIALDELRVLARLKEPFSDCLLDVRHPIGVEVIPGAITMVQARLSSNQSSARKRQSQLSLFDSVYD